MAFDASENQNETTPRGDEWRPDSGAILILVLWAIGLLAVIGAIVIASARIASQEAATMRGGEVAKGLAEAGVRYGTQLWRSEDPRIAQGNFRCEAETGYLRIHVAPAASRLDINLATEAQLEALFAALGADPQTAETAAAYVADYRDTDRTPRAHGGEDKAYESAGLPYGPKNDLMASVSELAHIPAVPGWLYSAAYPYLTTRGNLMPDAQYAEEIVLAASLASDDTPTFALDPAEPTLPDARPVAAANPVRSVPLHIRAAAQGKTGGHYVIDAEVLGSAGPTTTPYIARLDVVSIRNDDFPLGATDQLPPCRFGESG